MLPSCYLQGTCIKCGCLTTALQMANKSCDLPCYPEMMGRNTWINFKNGYVIKDKKGRWALRTGKEVNNNQVSVCQYVIFYPKDNGEKQTILITDKTKLTYGME